MLSGHQRELGYTEGRTAVWDEFGNHIRGKSRKSRSVFVGRFFVDAKDWSVTHYPTAHYASSGTAQDGGDKM